MSVSLNARVLPDADFEQIYALYERSRAVLIVLVTLCALQVTVMGVLIVVTMSHLQGRLYYPTPNP